MRNIWVLEVFPVICYIVRHGKDDETVRGGWSGHSLVPEGVAQVKALGAEMVGKGIEVGRIYSSDIQRAKETALILKEYLHCQVEYLPEFREANNGDLAGLKHEVANEKFPGIYWSALDYSECYPGGESPEQFFSRVQAAWAAFKEKMAQESNGDVVLVTHGGVAEAILCIENAVEFTNKVKHFATPSAKLIPIVIE